MELNNLKLDIEKQEEGVWVPLDGDTSILVARMHNKKFNKLFQRLSAPYRNTARKGLLKDEKAEEILSIVIAKTVLIGWKGLTENGKDLPYSVEKATELLSDEKFSSFKEMVIEAATDEASYREDEIEETAKKLGTSLVGISNGEKA